jgi:hypothetical protein
MTFAVPPSPRTKRRKWRVSNLPDWRLDTRVLAISAKLLGLLSLAVLAGWIWFHVLAPNRFAGGSALLGSWRELRDYIMQNEHAFDAVVFFGVLLLIVLMFAGWRMVVRFAHAPEEPLAAWAGQLELKDRLQLEIALRAGRIQLVTTIAQIAGIACLLIGIYFIGVSLTIPRPAQINPAPREVHVTDQLVRAIEELGAIDNKGNPAGGIRLEGIYDLRRIANHASEYYGPIRQVLNDYVRLNAPLAAIHIPQESGQAGAAVSPAPNVLPGMDIQAALDFLGARLENYDMQAAIAPLNLSLTALSGADLSRANLAGANLSGADLSGAHLFLAKLENAYLIHTDLRNAVLMGADLTHTDFREADLEDSNLMAVNLVGANLAGANLTGANLTSAHLSGADFSGANLSAADLSDAKGLDQQQIELASGDRTTRLPWKMRMPNEWRRTHAARRH